MFPLMMTCQYRLYFYLYVLPKQQICQNNSIQSTKEGNTVEIQDQIKNCLIENYFLPKHTCQLYCVSVQHPVRWTHSYCSSSRCRHTEKTDKKFGSDLHVHLRMNCNHVGGLLLCCVVQCLSG